MPFPCRWLVLLAALLVVHPAVAQQATASAEFTPNPLAPNQVGTYTITIDGANPTGVPMLNLPENWVPQGGVSTQNEISIVNGLQSVVVHFSWSLICTKEGSYTLPGVAVPVGRSTLKTNDVKVEVKAGAAPPKPDGVNENQDNGLGALEPILQLHMAKTEFYQGEMVPITATLYLPRSVQLRRLGLIEVEKSDLAIQRFPQQAEQSLETLGSQRYIALTFRSSLSALKAGKIKVGPAKTELLLDVPVGGRNSVFGFMQMDERKVTVKAGDVLVNVLPLPAEGRPPGFTGAVGDFTMTASSNVTEASVGDPVAVDVMIEGQGNFDAIEAPVLSEPSGWKVYPPKRYNVDTGDPNTADLINRKLGFNIILIPEKVMGAVPAFEFSFFSSRTRQYVHLRSQPLSLKIKPAANAPATVMGVLGGGNAATSPPSAAVSPAPEADITDILMPVPAQAHWAVAVTPLLKDLRFTLGNAVLLTAFVLLLLWAWWQRLQQKRRRAPEYALKQLWHEVAASGLSEAEFYRRAAHYVMQLSPEQCPEEARAILAAYEALNFAGPQAGAGKVDSTRRSEVLTVLRKLATHRAKPSARVAMAVLLAVLSTQASASPEEQYRTAAQALERKDFKTVQQTAEALVKQGEISPEVFTLLGHASYKQGQPGIAAMWYQRAQMFPASAPELHQNLRHIAEKTHFLSFTRNEWLERFGLLLSRNAWLLLSCLGGWLVIFSSAFLLLGARRPLRGWAVTTLVAGSVAGVLGLVGYKARPGMEDLQSLAFVMAEKAQAHTAATQVSGNVIAVPSGSVVRKLQERGNWTYVEIPQPGDSLRGWLPTNQLEAWWPYDAVKLP